MSPTKKKKEEPKEEPKKKKVRAVDAIDKNGNYIRTFDEERHGPEFQSKAKEFCRDVANAPDINLGRKIVEHPYKGITKVRVVNTESGKEVATFSKDKYGFGFREQAQWRAAQEFTKKKDSIVGKVEEVGKEKEA